jgi:hypothetical protein
MDYFDDDFVAPGVRSSPSGSRIFKKDGVAELWFPSWNYTTTVIRPYPAKDKESGKFLPYRLDAAGSAKFSPWIRSYYVAYRVGDPPVSFIIRKDPSESTFDPWNTPLGILYSTLNSACRNGTAPPKWYQLRDRTGPNAFIRPPTSQRLFIQGVILAARGKDYYLKPETMPGFGSNNPVVFVVPSGASKVLYNMLQEEVPGWTNPEDFESRYRYGDPVALDKGRFFIFRQKEDAQNIGYDVRIEKTYGNMRASFPESVWGTIYNKILPWEDILYFPTYKEQAHLLARAFSMVPDLVIAAFGPVNKEWIPEEIINLHKGLTQVSMPQAPPFMTQPQVNPQTTVHSQTYQAQVPFISQPVPPQPPQPPGVVRPPVYHVQVPTMPVQQPTPAPASPVDDQDPWLKGLSSSVNDEIDIPEPTAEELELIRKVTGSFSNRK